jgi:hypothetical protein
LRGIELLKVQYPTEHAEYDPSALRGSFRFERRNLNAHCDKIIDSYLCAYRSLCLCCAVLCAVLCVCCALTICIPALCA